MNNSFVKLLLETLGITEEQTVEISRIMDAYDIKPCVLGDVLQPAVKGEKVGETLVPIMQFRVWDEFQKKNAGNIDYQFYNPHVKDGHLTFGKD